MEMELYIVNLITYVKLQVIGEYYPKILIINTVYEKY